MFRLDETQEPTAQKAPLRITEDFVPGHLGTCLPFWKLQILKEASARDREMMLGWLNGVKITDFVDKTAKGTFLGKEYNGEDLTGAVFDNHVPNHG